MAITMRISIQMAVSDTYTKHFHQAIKENDTTEFLKAAQKKFADLISMGIVEMIPHSIVPYGWTLFPELWYIH